VPAVKYETQEIQFHHIVDKALKQAYITVDFYEGFVVLKSRQSARKRPKKQFIKRANGCWKR